MASLPKMRKVQSMSNPMLVATIRRLSREHTIFRLKNDGQDPPTTHLLRAAIAEAERRRLTINHPEYIDDQDSSEDD